MTYHRTPEIDAEFRRLWHAGEKVHDIAKALGMRKTTTYDYRVSLGLTDRPIPGANIPSIFWHKRSLIACLSGLPKMLLSICCLMPPQSLARP